MLKPSTKPVPARKKRRKVEPLAMSGEVAHIPNFGNPAQTNTNNQEEKKDGEG